MGQKGWQLTERLEQKPFARGRDWQLDMCEQLLDELFFNLRDDACSAIGPVEPWNVITTSQAQWRRVGGCQEPGMICKSLGREFTSQRAEHTQGVVCAQTQQTKPYLFMENRVALITISRVNMRA